MISPGGVLLLFGAGIAIVGAFVSSGLSITIGTTLSELSTLAVLAMIATICLVVTFMTETTSNTATATLLTPILATAALGAKIDPALFRISAALSAFMLPVATAPNAVMFSTGAFSTGRMAEERLALNFIGVIVITAVCYAVLT